MYGCCTRVRVCAVGVSSLGVSTCMYLCVGMMCGDGALLVYHRGLHALSLHVMTNGCRLVSTMAGTYYSFA